MGSKNTPIKLKNGGGYIMDSKLIENMNLEEDVSVLVSNLKNIEGEYKEKKKKKKNCFRRTN